MPDRYDAVVRSIARERAIDLQEAQRWCEAWEQFAKRAGVAPSGPHYWDSARGWIDAQRFFQQQKKFVESERAG